jgi:hypothetical protein
MQGSGMVLAVVSVCMNRGFSQIGTDPFIFSSALIRENPRLHFFKGCVVPADLGGAQ